MSNDYLSREWRIAKGAEQIHQNADAIAEIVATGGTVEVCLSRSGVKFFSYRKHQLIKEKAFLTSAEQGGRLNEQ